MGLEVTAEKFADALFDRCEFELKQLDELHALNNGCHPNDVTNRYKALFPCREKILLIMERLASGKTPPKAQTSWDIVNKDDL